MILSRLLSLAGKLVTPFWGAAGFVGLGAKSMAGSLLGGGWLRFLLNPYTLLAIALMASHGWAYSRGKKQERLVQARAIVALNNEVIDWRKQYEAVDTQAEIRLQKALEEWRRNTGTTAVIASTCKLPPNAVRTISDIAGD